jgi:hypothetical protein
MFRSDTQTQAQALHPIARFAPAAILHRLLDVLVEADRNYREARKLDRLDESHLRDMRVDPSRALDGN